LSCDPDYAAGPRPPYDPATPAIEAAWLAKVQAYAADCGTAGGKLLDNLKTIDNVRDMNGIRQALGQKQINYYGFSYGTYLGQVFATVYPERVRRMVLDANVDPRRVWYQANLDQDFAFETVFQRFADWVARFDESYHLGTTGDEVEAAYYEALHELATSPQGALGAAEWADAFLVLGYAQGAWPDVADAFAAFVNSDDAGPATDLFLNGVDTTNDNGYAMYLATECSDTRWPKNWRVWQRDNTRVAAQAPFLTWGNAWFNAPCAFWPARSGEPVEVTGKAAPPILLLSETLDAATPFSGSLEVRRRFPKAALVATEGGTTHANSLNGNPCVDDPIVAYLVDGSLPARVRGKGPDVVCEAAPEPVPNALVPAVASGAAARAGVARSDFIRLRAATLR
jgi:pimeloyl-ACP methyl ester carboxylesterase